MRPDVFWRNPDFLLLWSGQAVSTLGSSVSRLALPLLVLALTRSPAQAGLIAALQSIPYLIFSLPAGALIDRWDRKRVMIRCDAARCLAYGSVPLAYATAHLSMAQLYAVALVGGTAYVFFNIAEVAALPRVVPAEQLSRATALNESATSASSLIGPGLGGLIISLGHTTVSGAALAYLVDSLSYAASTLALAFIHTPFQAERTPVANGSLRAEIAEGLRFLWTRRPLRAMALLTMGMNLFFGPLPLAVIVLARTNLHADARTLGLIFSAGSVGGLCGSVMASWVKARLRIGQVIAGSTASIALATPLLGAAVSVPMLLAGYALIGVMIPVYNVVTISYRLILVPDALQGRVNSVFRLLGLGSVPLGAAIGGLLLTVIGPRAELWLIAAGFALCAIAVAVTAVQGHVILDRQDALTPHPMRIGLSALPAGRQPTRPLPTRGRGGAAPCFSLRERDRPRE